MKNNTPCFGCFVTIVITVLAWAAISLIVIAMWGASW